MITLDSVLKSLEIKLAGAAATTELPYVSAYVDLNQSTWALTGAGEQDGVTTGGTAKEVVAAPGATTSRKLNYLSVVNVDTVPAVLTVQVNNNATKRIVFSATLAVGDQLSYTDAFGWKIFDSSGNQKTTMQIAPLTVTNAMLAGSITAAKLVATDFTAITASGLVTMGSLSVGTGTQLWKTVHGTDTYLTGYGGTQKFLRHGNGQNVLFSGGASGLIVVNAAETVAIMLLTDAGALQLPNYGAGAATFDASGNVTSVSDLRDKDVIGPYGTGLAALRRLAPIRYRWKAAKGLDRGRTYVGFGAQDVLPWVPDAVDQHWLPDSTDATAIGEDRYSFNPIVLLAVLINAMKELELRVDALDGRRVPDPTPIRAQDFQAAIGLDATLLDPLDLAQKVRRTGTGRFPPPPPETRP